MTALQTSYLDFPDESRRQVLRAEKGGVGGIRKPLHVGDAAVGDARRVGRLHTSCKGVKGGVERGIKSA